jgi:hypothetical protein
MDAVYHDRFILHGAGYSGRYQAGLDATNHGIYSDDYMATEMLTGHPAMVSQPQGRDVVRKYWLTHDAMRALAMRTIESVEFAGGDLHRQKVTWSGGGSVWVNRGQSDWEVGALQLPQYGFLVKVPTDLGAVTASIHRSEGLIVEQSQSAHALYANARGSLGQRKRIRPRIADFSSDDANRLQRRSEIAGLDRFNVNLLPVDFGWVLTAGGCRLERHDDFVVLTPLPEEYAGGTGWTLRWDRLPWKLPRPTRVIAIDEASRTIWERALDGLIVIEHDPAAFAYRLEQ